jgi:hypothetical protein
MQIPSDVPMPPRLQGLSQHQEIIRAHRLKTDLHDRKPPTEVFAEIQKPIQQKNEKHGEVPSPHSPPTFLTYERVSVDTHNDIDELLTKVHSLGQDMDAFGNEREKEEHVVIDPGDDVVLTLNREYSLDPSMRINSNFVRQPIAVDESFSPSVSTTSSRSNSPLSPTILQDDNFERLNKFHEYAKRVKQNVKPAEEPVTEVEMPEPESPPKRRVIKETRYVESSDEEVEQVPRRVMKREKTPESPSKKVKKHKHHHVHVRRPQYRILLHILNGRLTNTKNAFNQATSLVLKYKVSLDNKPETRIVKEFDLTENSTTTIDACEMIILDNLDPSEFVPTLGKNSLVVELHNKEDNSYFGIFPISLRPFFEAFTHPDLFQDDESKDPLYLNRGEDMPVISFHGQAIFNDPLTDLPVARLNLMLAFGSKGQINRLTTAQKAALTIQQYYRRWKRYRPVAIPRSAVTYVPENQYDEPHKPEPNVNTSMHDEVLYDNNMIDKNDSSDDSDDEYENRLMRRSQRRVTRKETEHTSPDKSPGNRATITVKVIRATGLQRAAQAVLESLKESWKKSSLETSCQTGVNPRIVYENILPAERDRESEYSTDILATTHFPVWNYQKQIDFIFDKNVYDHFDQAEATFALYHHIPRERIVKDRDGHVPSNVVLLAECRVPLFPLIRSPAGINDWCNLQSAFDANTVGAVEISIQLDDRTKSLLFSDDTRTVEQLDTIPDVCRFMIVVEDIKIPQETLRAITPQYLLMKDVFECRYTISYRFYDRDRIESRQYLTSNIVNKLQLNHSVERKRVLDTAFVNRLMCEKLSIDLHVALGEEEREKLYLGTAYVDMSQLMYKRQASNRGKVLISGLVPLINPNSENLTNGFVRVVVMCETLSKNATQEYLERMGYHDRVKVEEQINDIDIESEPEITMDEFDTRFKITEENDIRSVIEEPQTQSRRRVEETVTVSPRHTKKSPVVKRLDLSQVTENVETQTSSIDEKSEVSSTPSDDDEVQVINQLGICIERAYHLPAITTTWSASPILPSCYVKVLTFRDKFDASTEHVASSGLFPTHLLKQRIDNGHVRAVTEVVYDTVNPEWNSYITLPLTRQVDSIVFQVWHKSGVTGKDRLIGECVVDLGMLAYGLDRIDGWYHLENRSVNLKEGVKQPIAQIKISVAPEKPYVLIHRSPLESLRMDLDLSEENFVENEIDSKESFDEFEHDDFDDEQLKVLLQTTLQDLDRAMTTVTQSSVAI